MKDGLIANLEGVIKPHNSWSLGWGDPGGLTCVASKAGMPTASPNSTPVWHGGEWPPPQPDDPVYSMGIPWKAKHANVLACMSCAEALSLEGHVYDGGKWHSISACKVCHRPAPVTNIYLVGGTPGKSPHTVRSQVVGSRQHKPPGFVMTAMVGLQWIPDQTPWTTRLPTVPLLYRGKMSQLVEFYFEPKKNFRDPDGRLVGDVLARKPETAWMTLHGLWPGHFQPGDHIVWEDKSRCDLEIKCGFGDSPEESINLSDRLESLLESWAATAGVRREERSVPHASRKLLVEAPEAR